MVTLVKPAIASEHHSRVPSIDAQGRSRVDEPSFLDQFALDVLNGLTSKPKNLSSLYLYDDAGSRLYAAITETEEYYPTR